MEWIEAVIHTTTEGSDLVSELLMRCGAIGTQVQDRADVEIANRDVDAWELFDKDLASRMPEDVLVIGWFSQEKPKVRETLEEQLAALRAQAVDVNVGTLRVDLSSASNDDWAESWKQYYKPFRIGEHWIVKPTWEPYSAQETDVVVELDPGMAFGTGTHETTNMCMVLLEKFLQKGMRVMDIGTGSGILAIGAAKLGAQSVLAIDIDTDAVKVARENIARNGVEATVRAVQGNMVLGAAMECDLAVANIVAGAICVLAEPIKKYLRVGGILLCSGIIKEREQDVITALADSYSIVERLTLGEWVALSARREK